MTTVFRGGQVFDGTGEQTRRADVVVGADGRIAKVGKDLKGDVVVDLRGKTLLPGLFDCHVHVTIRQFDPWKMLNEPYSLRYYHTVQTLEATLATGITSARDAGGADLGIKQALLDGLIRGPRLQISLTMLSQTGGHGDDWLASGASAPIIPVTPGIPSSIVDGLDEMRRKVRELHRMGADVIKVATSGGVLSARDDPRHPHFRPAELEVLVEEATAAGMFVMAHAQATDGIKNAVRAGIRSIEHGIFLDDEAIELMLEHGTWLVPTLVAPLGVIEAAEAGTKFSPGVLEKAKAVVEIHQAAVARAVKAGVKIAMGTDAGASTHGKNLRELELMVKAGMTPAAALRAATSSAAELLGVDRDLGTIEAGKLADLVVVDGDPFDVSTLAGRIDSVWMGGAQVA